MSELEKLEKERQKLLQVIADKEKQVLGKYLLYMNYIVLADDEMCLHVICVTEL